MKQNPESTPEFEIPQSKRLGDFVSDQLQLIDQDQNDRYGWLEQKRSAYRRRYVMDFRNPTMPWAGSSNIVLPLIDMVINNHKSGLVNLHKANPVCRLEPMDYAYQDKQMGAEAVLNHFLNVEMKDYMRQVKYGADNILTYGYGLYKIFWQYQSRSAREVVNADRLPAYVNDFVARATAIIAAGGVVDSEKAAAKAIKAGQGLKMPNGQVIVVTRSEIREMARKIIHRAFELDPDERREEAETERLLRLIEKGEGSITITKRDVLYNGPRVVAVSPFDLIIPQSAPSVEDSWRIVHRMWFDYNSLQAKVRDSGWNKGAVDEILKRYKDGKYEQQSYVGSAFTAYEDTEADRAERAGLNWIPRRGLIPVFEFFCYYDLDKDGYDEKVILTIEPETKLILKARELNYAHGDWPFIGIHYEENEPNYYSHRGLPEIMDDLDAEATATERFKINCMQITTAPIYKYRKGGPFAPENISWLPGSGIPVSNMQDVDIMQFPVMWQAHQSQENSIRAVLEQYTGGVDFALTGPTGTANEARTAREISALMARTERTISLPVGNYVDGWKRIFSQVWANVQQFCPPEVQARTAGGKLMLASKEDIQGEYELVPNMPVGNYDPALNTAFDLGMLQTLVQVAPLMAADQRYTLDLPTYVRGMIERRDPRVARQVIREKTPQEVQQQQQAQAQESEMQYREREANIAAKMGAASGSVAAAMQSAQQMAQAEQQPMTPEQAFLGGGG